MILRPPQGLRSTQPMTEPNKSTQLGIQTIQQPLLELEVTQ